MAENVSDSNDPKLKSRTTEERISDASPGPSTAEDKAEDSGETGYTSAPHTSDLCSGAEGTSDFCSGAEGTSDSAAWASEDHPPVGIHKQESPAAKKLQKKAKSSKQQCESSESDSKPEIDKERSTEKISKTKSQTTPPKQTTSAEGSHKSPSTGSASRRLASGDPASTAPKVEGGEALSKKGKSPKKSFFERITSPLKKSPSKPGSPGREGTTSKSPKSKATTSSPSGTKTEQPSGSEENSASSASPLKRKGLFSIVKTKSPAKQKCSSAQGGSSVATSPRTKVEKISEIRSKFTYVRKSPKKHGKETSHSKHASNVEEQPQSGKRESISSTCERVSSGIQSIQLSRKANESDLLLSPEESMDTTGSEHTTEKGASATGGGKNQETRVESATELRRKAWRSQNPHQEGGFLNEIVFASSSSAEDTGTEMSTVSSSSAIQGGSESRKGVLSSSDTFSDISLLREEGATGGQELNKISLLPVQQRLKEIDSSGSDEES